MVYGKLAATANTSFAKYWFDLPLELNNNIGTYLKTLVDTESNPVLSDRIENHYCNDQLESGFIPVEYDGSIIYFNSFCSIWRIYSEIANPGNIRQLAIKEMIYQDMELLSIQ